MTRSTESKRADFRALHASGCFVIPNPWDIGSAKMLQHLGFSALASTSSGFAWTQGKADYDVTLEAKLAHLGAICAAVDLPVNADFESGFANEPAQVAANVTRAIATGVAGISIEDTRMGEEGLFETADSITRLRAAKKAIEDSKSDVLLIARTEILLHDPKQVKLAIERLVAFAEAGADVLYAPGVKDKSDIAAMVKAVAPKPVNVLVMDPSLTMQELAELGVRRISVGGSLARVGWGAVMAAAERMKAGSFAGLTGMKGSDLNGMFSRP